MILQCVDHPDTSVLKCVISTTGVQRSRIRDCTMQLNARVPSLLFIPGCKRQSPICSGSSSLSKTGPCLPIRYYERVCFTTMRNNCCHVASSVNLNTITTKTLKGDLKRNFSLMQMNGTIERYGIHFKFLSYLILFSSYPLTLSFS